MGILARRPSIKKTCDFCNSSAFGLMRRHSGGKTFCSPHCEASFANCRMIEETPDRFAGQDGDFIAALSYPRHQRL
ncbi:hypothetical protein GGQ85_003654 [Nitrobacter vulgaris]|uniref:hypothetical protein n=1 Tax=Nitrobacter vulgaris TaxID=29421 RepID=UPI00285ED455|nr:hypothetical protein [Nitrobacter vulgaris]MDR6305928.1 hypothetical protein [Nitrobacter vulgaris]